MQRRRRWRHGAFDNECVRRGIVEQEQYLREEPVATREIDDTSTSESSPDATRDFPGFVQLLAREAPGVAHRAREPIEQRVRWEATEVVMGQTCA
ncbi:MAG: hypothetical protein QM736_01935 [Vicinamibacterales bacterium]